MGLEDFVPIDPKPSPAAPRRPISPSAEDEDLFDFPVIVMRAGEAAATARPAPPRRAAPAAIPDADVQAIVREIGARPPSARRADDEMKDIAAAVDLVDELDAILSEPDPVLHPASAASHEPLLASDEPEGLEHAHDPFEADETYADEPELVLEPAPTSAVADRMRSAARQAVAVFAQSRTQAAAAVIGALLLLNVVVFLASWKMNREFHAGLASLRADLGFSAGEAQAHSSQPNGAPTQGETPRTTGSDAQRGRSKPVAPSEPAVTLEAFERTALAIARDEIETGAYAAARVRLARLLAVADRIEASVRDDIEAQAGFLVADSYRRQARARREVAR